MNPEEAQTRALELLRGHGSVSRVPPLRRALAKALPLAAEFLCCTQGTDLDAARQALTQRWLSLELDELKEENFGARELGVGCMEAAEILGLRLPARPLPPRHAYSPERDLSDELASQRRKLSRPRVLVPLANEVPARVFHTTRPGPPIHLEAPFRDTALLVERFLGIAAPRWTLEHAASGRSMMAALLVRALLEQWPESAARLVPGWRDWNEFPAIGFTGELDTDGLVVPVGELEDKIRRFFANHPDGRLFVPETQWKQARELLEKHHPPEKSRSRNSAFEREVLIQPFRGALDLLVRLGINPPNCRETQHFEQLRQAARQISCWNGKTREVSQTLSLKLEWIQPGGRSSTDHPSLEEDEFLSEVYKHWRAGPSHPACIEGKPGSGKSIVLRRLCAHLLGDNPLLGPALWVEARRLVRMGFSMSRALHDSWLPILDEKVCEQLVQLAQDPSLRGGVWLLVDGVDEVSAEDRRKIRELMARWPGPSIMGARPLPNEAPGNPHVRVAPLSEHQQQHLFELEGRAGHWMLLKEKSENIYRSRPSDRRKEMIADLCSTPLGISLLALRPESELGEGLDVPTVLRGSISTLLQRAEEAQRISKQDRWRVAGQGLGILGAAAWSMIRRGESVLTFEDLETMRGPSKVVESIHQVLDNSDLIQRVGPDLYQFSHKSLAELCAALHLKQRPEAEAELLERIGEPGAEAVASHFAAQLQDAKRLTAFIRQLSTQPRRPLSSLALATRLLVANGPKQLNVEEALAVLVRRVRLASHSFERNWRVLPGGLDDDGEMWLALKQWARELRPHAGALLAACPSAMRDFLRGAPPPPLERPFEVGRKLGPALAFAERLALTVGMDVPLAVYTRMEAGSSVLMSRPDGPWLMELEALMDAGDASPGSEHTATTVWVQRASEKRLLERLDVLSRQEPTLLAPLLATVVKKGRPQQKREALLRAALNMLELGERDNEGDWVSRASFAGKTTELSSEQWLRLWELLWGCGLVGAYDSRDPCLEALYAEFVEDGCGPARWRALVALQHLQSPIGPERFRAALQDGFRPTRLQAMALLAQGGHTVDPTEVWRSLHSLDAHERWIAFDATGLSRKAPLELLLAVLAHEKPRPREKESSSSSRWLPTETPWEEATRSLVESARNSLVGEVRRRSDESGYQALASFLDGPNSQLVEELFPTGYGGPSTAFFLQLLKGGSPAQRRFAIRRLHFQCEAEALTPFVEDADPGVAHPAREALKAHQERLQNRAEFAAIQDVDRRAMARREGPVLELKALQEFDSFEALWRALSEHTLPDSMEAQLAFHRELDARRWSPEEHDVEDRLETVSDRVRKPFLQRLRELYRPTHQSLLLTGLTDERLAPFAVALLREQLPAPGLIALISRGGRLLEYVVEILKGTAHAAQAAQRIREEALADRLRPKTDPYRRLEEPFMVDVDRPTHVAYAAKEVRDWVFGQLEWMDGIAALLPWLEPSTPEPFRSESLKRLRSSYHERWNHRVTPDHPGLLRWARSTMEDTQDEEVREIALWILSVRGDARDAHRCRPLLEDPTHPPRVLGLLLRLHRRFASREELPLFRSFLTHSPEAASEAVAALVHLGGDSVVEELLLLLESPPPSLADHHLFHCLVDWNLLAATAIIQLGDRAQARRLARLMANEREVWRVAVRHLRLPEHLLLIAGHLGNQDPASDDDDGYEQARSVLEEMLRHVDAVSARRVMIEAIPWGDTFERSFEDCVSVQPEDEDLILSALREQPDHPIVLKWLGSLAQAEELLDEVWREQGVPWWNATASG